MELKEAQQIAEETLRVVATHIDAYNIREFIGAELDLDDESMLEALETLNTLTKSVSVGDVRRNGR